MTTQKSLLDCFAVEAMNALIQQDKNRDFAGISEADALAGDAYVIARAMMREKFKILTGHDPEENTDEECDKAVNTSFTFV